MKTLKDIEAEAGTIKAQVIEDADNEVLYIKNVAEHGCSGGNCKDLIYYTDTEAFYAKHADEIEEMLEEYEDSTGENVLARAQIGGNLRNFLAWWSYEVRAQEIESELEEE